MKRILLGLAALIAAVGLAWAANNFATTDFGGNVKVFSCTDTANVCTLNVNAISAPSSSSAAGIAPVVSTALETGHVLLAGPGNLYGVEVSTTTAAGYLLVFNSTTVPAAGAVSPVAHCYVVSFGTCALNFAPPLVLSTGISVAFSSAATPFTKTDSATASFSGQVQ